jgi:enamine deaminase RidA (YjgF/YER057c/UK114 family)
LDNCPPIHRGESCENSFDIVNEFTVNQGSNMSADVRLAELGFQLPPAPQAVGVYQPALTVGNICYTSGHLPIQPDGSLLTGCVGNDVDQEAGFQAAHQAGLTMLATLQSYLGSLDHIKRVIKLLGMVNCTADFTQQPAVINGCSQLMAKVFGEEAGVGTRSAVGVSSLPLGVVVEIEGIFELHQ